MTELEKPTKKNNIKRQAIQYFIDDIQKMKKQILKYYLLMQ